MPKHAESLVVTSVKLPPTLLADIRAVAESRGVSRFIRQAAKERLEQLQKSKTPTA